MPDGAPTPTRLTAESGAEATVPLFQVTANKQLNIVEMARLAPLPLPPPVGIDLSSDKERLESAGARDLDADRTLTFIPQKETKPTPYCVTTNIRNVPGTGSGRGCAGVDPGANFKSAVGR
jgi:hypothetical protein